MIRNLLYSICLHLLFFLLLIFSDKINVAMNDEILNISTLKIDKDFVKDNELDKIKISKNDLYSNLTLEEKIKLYQNLKTNNELNRSSKVHNGKGNIRNEVKKYINSDNFKIKSSSIIKNKNNVIYLGPNDYAKLMANKDRENKEKQELENLKILQEEKIRKKKEEEEKDRRLVIKQEKLVEEAKLLKILEQEKQENEKKKDNVLEAVEIEKAEQQQNKETKILIESKKMEADDGLLIEDNIKSNNSMIKTEEIVDEYQLDININEIFTGEDLKKIRETLKETENIYSLSLREKLNIQNQIRTCYKNAILENGRNSPVSVSVNLQVFKDGIINTNEIKVKIIDNENKYTQEEYKISIDNAKLAIKYCNPLRNLPILKYKTWQNINFIFDNSME